MYLENINSPKDLKALDMDQLTVLASEIRDALLHNISEIGGHFGPNFGLVEASIALHYVFNSPVDKFVFDVSHQSYIHKMLTGRKDAYTNPEKYRSVTGFTNPEESNHDFFNIGHTSTSIGLATGLAKARDLAGRNENIIAIIGDGSMTGGQAFAGLNVASEQATNLIVVVNDNDMAIAEAHGGLIKHFAELRANNGNVENNYFKALGFDYYYVAEGNSIEPLVEVFKKVKDTTKPVVVHINTQKGKGYKVAENNKEGWHWIAPFDIETGKKKLTATGEFYGNIVGDYLFEKMQKDPSVVYITPAVPMTIGFTAERRKLAGRQYVDVGISEEQAVTMAAGVAKNGGKPVVATHSTFYQRTYDQISHDLCINNVPATLLVRNGSVWGANDVTHLGFFDIAMMSNIPNLVYLAPTNCEEYLAMLDWSIEQTQYPVAIRIPCNAVTHTTEPVEKDYSNLNKNLVTIMGEKVAIFALGDFYQMGEEFVAAIKDELGFQPTLINPRYITGLDTDLLESLKKDHQLVITLEDGIIEGGYGQKIASYYGDSDMKVKNFGLKKEFVDGYDKNKYLIENHICVNSIFHNIKTILQ